ncbi:globoside alpha-1,3-N-acetylgalactosaminyltransferase 1-like isoform X1 [Gadus macrocephalus]|uniref:globoside alpha-1,3-N-acetylgalactosaminyltransferase 1-like isoform X1 n=1 Tax=Gadus macrocephalus TaxID=80720 RepID=UPI0028CB6FEA|nr:globoside alpha-1,3-N-acetylgalactosaminyltransferase 1-like isoform X1 [Gadus macrocephalus]
MALFMFSKCRSGPVRVSKARMVLCSLLLSLLIYLFQRSKATVLVNGGHPPILGLEPVEGEADTPDTGTSLGHQPLLETPWGAPLVWGESSESANHRAKFSQREVRVGLLVLAVGAYGLHLRRFLLSAEVNFLPGRGVTYYVLCDNPRSLEPPIKLAPERDLKVVPVAEMPGWDRLARRRMDLIAAAIKDEVGDEVAYVFCADVDQEFTAPVREEILSELVATLHPELYGMPRHAFPYEIEESSAACVDEDEGDLYYTSELYGGRVAEVFRLARACSLLILEDQEKGFMARGMEESYLNRYLIDHRPTCVLSPEYSWWDSALSADVPVQRLISLGRQCEALDERKREERRC